MVLSGTLHQLFHVTVREDGSGTVVRHSQPQGLTGVGEITGDAYRATGAFHDTFKFGKLPLTYGVSSQYRIIGPGPDNNHIGSWTWQYIVNANGTVTVDHYSESLECR